MATAHDPIQQLNDHHRDDVLLVARYLAGHADAAAASVSRIDADGIELSIREAAGDTTASVPFGGLVEPSRPQAIRRAFYDLVKQARAVERPAEDQP